MIELSKVEKEYPIWPDEILHCAYLISEKACKLVMASINYHCYRGDMSRVIREAHQLTAMGIRFIMLFYGSFKDHLDESVEESNENEKK